MPDSDRVFVDKHLERIRGVRDLIMTWMLEEVPGYLRLNIYCISRNSIGEIDSPILYFIKLQRSAFITEGCASLQYFGQIARILYQDGEIILVGSRRVPVIIEASYKNEPKDDNGTAKHQFAACVCAPKIANRLKDAK